MPKKKSAQENVLVDVAKAIGTAAGKVVSLAGAASDELRVQAKSLKKGKLPKKHKARMPRRKKKAQQKTASRH